jgi:hypothetical protein
MRKSVFFFLLVFAACDSTQVEAPPPLPAPPADSRPSITLASPDVIRENPIRFGGTARTFENNVVVRVRDTDGNLMIERAVTATGETGTFNPWSAELYITRDPGDRVTLEALEYSAKDGSERSVARAAVRFEVPIVELTVFAHDPERAPTDCSRVFPLIRRVPKATAVARLLVEVLLSTDLFPRGAQANSVNLRDGVLTVDFNERVQNVGGACRAQAIRASLERTLRTLPAVKQVAITANGDRELALQP